MIWRFMPYLLAFSAISTGLHSDALTDKALVNKGMIAWEKVDKNGRSCVSCHSPQGLELAFFDFDDETLARRAESHVSKPEAQDIVAMIHARRRQYKIYKPLDAMADRPLQPGGEVLPGNTPAERDAAFAKEIDEKLPLLTRGTIDSEKKAKDAAKEVLKINLKTLKVGFEFNRLSEDVFHGLDHAVVADWIPDSPVQFTDAAREARTAYQEDPSEENLKILLAALPLDLPTGKPADRLALHKYRALLHLEAQLVNPAKDELSPKQLVDNPYWDVAEIARIDRGLPLKQFGLPEDIRVKKDFGPPLYDQFGAMQLPWYWTGWISDPGLQHTGPSFKSRSAVYFGFALIDEGPYPMHAAFMFFRKQLSESFDPACWTRSSPQHYVMEYSSFLAGSNFQRITPKDPTVAAIYRRFVANEYRTSLYLLLEETKRTQMTDLKKPALAEARQMADYVEEQSPSSKPATESLLAQISRAFQTARQIQN